VVGDPDDCAVSVLLHAGTPARATTASDTPITDRNTRF